MGKHVTTLFEWALPACLRMVRLPLVLWTAYILRAMRASREICEICEICVQVRKEVKEISPTEDTALACRFVQAAVAG